MSDHVEAMTELVAIRKAWMRRIGLDEAEIDEHCEHSPPTSMADEMAEYLAAVAMKTCTTANQEEPRP